MAREIFKKVLSNGFYYLFIGNVFTHIATFGSYLIIAWLLTPEDLGRVKAVQSFIDILLVFSTFGLPYSMLKIISEDITFLLKRKVIYSGLILIMGISFLVLIIANVIAYLGLFSGDILINKYVNIYSFSIIPQAIVLYFFALFQARQRFKKLSYIQIFSKIIFFPIVIFSTYFFGVLGFFYAMIISFFFNAIVLIKKSGVALLWIKFFFSSKSAFRDLMCSEPRLFRYSSISFINQLISKITITFSFLYSNYLVIDRFEFGQYGFALTIIQSMQIIITSGQQFLVPRLSFYSDKPYEFKSYLYQSILKFYPLFLFIAIGAYFLYPLIVNQFFIDYQRSIIFFRILIIGWFVNSTFSFQGIGISTLGYFQYNLYSNLLKVLLIFLFTVVLVKLYGIKGAAYSNVIVGFLSAFVYNYFYRKAYVKSKLNLNKAHFKND